MPRFLQRIFGIEEARGGTRAIGGQLGGAGTEVEFYRTNTREY